MDENFQPQLSVDGGGMPGEENPYESPVMDGGEYASMGGDMTDQMGGGQDLASIGSAQDMQDMNSMASGQDMPDMNSMGGMPMQDMNSMGGGNDMQDMNHDMNSMGLGGQEPMGSGDMGGYTDMSGDMGVDMGGNIGGEMGGGIDYNGGDPFSAADEQAEPSDTKALDEFEAKWQLELQAKRQKEQDELQLVLEKANADLTEAKSEHDRMRDSRQQRNRSEEQQLLEKIEADLECDNPWERVSSLVNLQQDDASERDTSRMTKILIRLKNEPLSVSRSQAVQS